MAEHDFLSAALSDHSAGFTVQQLADAPTLLTIFSTIDGHIDNMRLGRLTPAERAHVGDASTADELRINQLYVNLSLRFPGLMALVGVAPTMMADAFRAEHALSQAEGVFRKLRIGARVGCVVAVADLTEQVDHVEAAALRRYDPQTSDVTPTEKAQIEARFFPLKEQRIAFYQRAISRKQRAARRAQELATALSASSQQQQALLQQEALRAAALPAPADPTTAPAHGKRKAGAKQLPASSPPAPKAKARAPRPAKTPGNKTSKKSPKTTG